MNFSSKIASLLRRVKFLFTQLNGAHYWARDEVVAQKNLILNYARLKEGQHLSFRQVGFGLYSQHDEDGILLYIFSRIGVQTYKAVELCCGTGNECNLANLLLNHRWSGLLIDGNSRNIRAARCFFQNRSETMHAMPNIVQAWITRENINQLLEESGYSGEIDLLSLDVDGVDYWLWESLTVISPKVVVLEYNHLHGPYKSVSVPYRDNFVAEFTQYGSDYAGASLAAFIKLGKRKGYRYVGSNAIGTNAFFVQNDVPLNLMPEALPEEAFTHPRAIFGTNVRYQSIKDKPWVEV